MTIPTTDILELKECMKDLMFKTMADTLHIVRQWGKADPVYVKLTLLNISQWIKTTSDSVG